MTASSSDNIDNKLARKITEALSGLISFSSCNLTVGVLETKPVSGSELVSEYNQIVSSNTEWTDATRVDRLIFVSHVPNRTGPDVDQDASDNPSDGVECNLIAAVLVSEYTIGSTLVVNIEKVDTSGASASVSAPSGTVSVMIKAYLAWLVDPASGFVNISRVQVHVFARSQPQYLFHRSSARKDKRVLTDSALVGWWMRLLGNAFSSVNEKGADKAEESLQQRIDRFWFVPGETSTSKLCKDLLRSAGDASADLWQWGLGTLSPQNTSTTDGADPKQREVVPCFPDDPLVKAVKMIGASDTKPSTVMEMLSIVGECKRVCALLCVRIDISSKPKDADASRSFRTAAVNKTDFDGFMRKWMDSDFHDAAACQSSSARLVDLFKNKFGSVASLSSVGIVASQLQNAPKTDSAPSSAPVLNINNLVKKKQPAPVDISNLVKRKKVE